MSSVDLNSSIQAVAEGGQKIASGLAEGGQKIAKKTESFMRKVMPIAFLVLAVLLALILKDNQSLDDKFIHKFLFSLVIVLTLSMTYKNFMEEKEYYEDMIEGFAPRCSGCGCYNEVDCKYHIGKGNCKSYSNGRCS